MASQRVDPNVAPLDQSRPVVGTVVSGVVDDGTEPVKVGGVAAASPAAVTDGQRVAALLTLYGALMANPRDSSGNEIQFGTADDKLIIGGTEYQIQTAFATVAASQTDSPVVAAVTSKKIRVVQAYMQCAGTATNVTLNTKPAGVGTAITPLFANGANGGEVLGLNPAGWCQTNAGEGLSATTGAGTSTGIIVSYVAIS